jgi:hypothetical protein
MDKWQSDMKKQPEKMPCINVWENIKEQEIITEEVKQNKNTNQKMK